MQVNEAIVIAMDLLSEEFPGNDTMDNRATIQDLAFENIRLADEDNPTQRRQIEFNIITLETELIVDNAIHQAEVINFAKKVALKALTLFIQGAIL